MRRRALLVGLAALPLLGGCAPGTSVWAPDAEVAKAVYRSGGPSKLALITVRNEGDGQGAHTALLIDASERVLFDPYGGWSDGIVAERNDVLHGFSPAAEARYLSYQAQDGYYYVRQEIAVPPEVAEQALRLAEGYGPVGMAQCTIAASNVLKQLPGFERITTTWFPESLSTKFARLPGVETVEVHGPSAATAD